MKNNFKITLIQTNIIWNNISKNLSNIENLLKKVENTNLVILPEVFDTAFVTDIKILDKKTENFTLNWMLKKAKEHNLAIAGSSITKTDLEYKNRFFFAKPNGNFEFYDKRHLFAIAGETKEITRGEKNTLVEFKNWRINLQICYDLRFPVWSRNTTNYDLLIYVANWPKSRIEQWKALLIARAIENQSYVIGVNRIGTDENGFIYSGKSIVVNHKGQILFEAPEDELSIETVELDLEKLIADRIKFPVLKDADKYKIIN